MWHLRGIRSWNIFEHDPELRGAHSNELPIAQGMSASTREFLAVNERTVARFLV